LFPLVSVNIKEQEKKGRKRAIAIEILKDNSESPSLAWCIDYK